MTWSSRHELGANVCIWTFTVLSHDPHPNSFPEQLLPVATARPIDADTKATAALFVMNGATWPNEDGEVSAEDSLQQIY